jgi:predicted nucleic acid-binding protein
MKAVFADTSFFLAALNPDDELHKSAIALSREIPAPRLTTDFVLLEVANAMRRGTQRTQFAEFYARLKVHPLARIVPVSQRLFERGYDLFCDRKDKEWSLTDCISFVVMSDAGLSESLTHDRHFEQAGFAALLR